MTSTLVLLRHGESTWNRENLFTGWTDVPLSELGVDEALPWENVAGKLVIKVPPALNKKIPCEHAFSFKIERA